MKPLPDLADVAAMAERGRRSALMGVRSDALEALRDALTECNSASFETIAIPAGKAVAAAERLIRFGVLWGEFVE